MTRTVRLQEIANARTGDKGNRLNLVLVCRDPAHYAAVAAQVTAERVAEVFATRKPTRVVRLRMSIVPPAHVRCGANLTRCIERIGPAGRSG